MTTIADLKVQTEGKMNKAIDALHNELASVRTGRATPSLLERVMVRRLWMSRNDAVMSLWTEIGSFFARSGI